jgi:hypothetical protein
MFNSPIFALKPMPVSNAGTGASRPKRGIVRERFDSAKLTAIDHAMGKCESWAKKIRSDESGVRLDDIDALLDALGLKAVDKAKACVDRAVFESYKVLAGAAITEPRKLNWDGDE